MLGKGVLVFFRGGVFADGGLLSYSGQIRYLPVKVYPEVYGESAKVTIHSYEGVVYKYSILVRDKEQREAILTRLKENPCRVFHKAPLITVIHPEASKKEGVIQLCKALTLSFEHTLVVGNSLKDWPMMSVVSHSCAVMNAEPLLKERARYTLNPDRLAAFFRFSNGDPIDQTSSDNS